MMDSIRDLKYALRRLARTPGFTLAALLTLGLGIGANTAIFSVINSVLLRPLPFYEPERLIGVWQTAPGVKITNLNASFGDYVTYREHSTTFEDVALASDMSASVTEFADPERVEALFTTFRLLPILGARPILGRDFIEKDNDDKSPEVVMLGYGYWQRRFGGDPKAVGRRIMIDGSAREIIGVLPKDFWFMDVGHDLVLPLRFNRAGVRLGGYNFNAVARLRRGVSIDQANADLRRMIDVEINSIPAPAEINKQMFEDARLGPNIRLLRDDLIGDIGKSLWVVMATIGAVLLIACANVANLLLVRAEGRSYEFAIRAALGAGRGRIAREMLAESLALALIGGALGAGFAVAVVKIVLKLSPARLPRFEQISVDSTALLFTFGISIAAGLALGVIPVFKQSGQRLAGALRGGGRSASAGRERNLARHSLAMLQVGLALVLLIGSGLMIRAFLAMRNVDPGFANTEDLLTLRVSIPRSAASGDKELLQMQRDLTDRLASLPGVTEVSMLNGLPMTGFTSMDPIFSADHPIAETQIPPLRRFFNAAPGAFHALGTPMRAGREFTWTECSENRRVVIISENFAVEYWGSAQAAIGRRIRSFPTEEWSEIIGVAGDIRYDGAEQKAPSSVYWTVGSRVRNSNSMPILVRNSRAGSESLMAEVRQAVWSVNRSLPITELRTMKEIYDRSMARTSFTLSLLAISGGMALLLAVVGIYAVISYTVAQKTREIGIRLALGAQQGSLKRMFVLRGLLWSGIGAAAGLAAAIGLSRLMAALLFEVSPFDPLTYLAATLGILAAAAAASYLPARRVTRVDPIQALRAE
jgi:putative ABC transport system permease protein